MGDGIDRLQRAGIASTLRVAPAARGITALIALWPLAFTGVEAGLSQENGGELLAGPGWGALASPAADRPCRLRTTAAAISRNCREVLTVPRMPSFSLWSEVPMVEPKRIISGAQDIREEDVREVREHEGACVLVSQSTDLFWREMGGALVADRLLPEIERTMNSISSVQDAPDPFTQDGGGHLTLYRSYSTGDRVDATVDFLK